MKKILINKATIYFLGSYLLLDGVISLINFWGNQTTTETAFRVLRAFIGVWMIMFTYTS